MKLCDRCGKTNMEFSTFTVETDLDQVKNRVTFSGSSWIKRVVQRYVNALLDTKVSKEVNVCQTCQSLMFRNLDKDI